MQLSFEAPVIGETCVAMGYPQTSEDALQHELLASWGRIDDVFPSERGGQVNYPSFQTSGLHLPAMSGGPVIDERGRVVGVISTGWDFSDMGEEPLGYAALTGALLELRVNLPTEEGVRATSVAEIVGTGLLGETGHVTFSRDAEERALLQW